MIPFDDAIRWAQQWAVAPYLYNMPHFFAVPVFPAIAGLARSDVRARAQCARACIRAIRDARRRGSIMPGVTAHHVARVVRLARAWRKLDA